MGGGGRARDDCRKCRKSGGVGRKKFGVLEVAAGGL